MSRKTDLTERAIGDLLAREERGMRPGEIAAALGLGSNATLGLLRSMVSQGKVALAFGDQGTLYAPLPSG